MSPFGDTAQVHFLVRVTHGCRWSVGVTRLAQPAEGVDPGRVWEMKELGWVGRAVGGMSTHVGIAEQGAALLTHETVWTDPKGRAPTYGLLIIRVGSSGGAKVVR